MKKKAEISWIEDDLLQVFVLDLPGQDNVACNFSVNFISAPNHKLQMKLFGLHRVLAKQQKINLKKKGKVKI